MAIFILRCTGPGPHTPADGVLGSSSVPPQGEYRCGSAACKPVVPVEATNEQTLRQQMATALVANRTRISAAKPGTAAAQASAAYDNSVVALQQVNGLIRLLLNQLDGTN